MLEQRVEIIKELAKKGALLAVPALMALATKESAQAQNITPTLTPTPTPIVDTMERVGLTRTATPTSTVRVPETATISATPTPTTTETVKPTVKPSVTVTPRAINSTVSSSSEALPRSVNFTDRTGVSGSSDIDSNGSLGWFGCNTLDRFIDTENLTRGGTTSRYQVLACQFSELAGNNNSLITGAMTYSISLDRIILAVGLNGPGQDYKPYLVSVDPINPSVQQVGGIGLNQAYTSGVMTLFEHAYDSSGREIVRTDLVADGKRYNCDLTIATMPCWVEGNPPATVTPSPTASRTPSPTPSATPAAETGTFLGKTLIQARGPENSQTQADVPIVVVGYDSSTGQERWKMQTNTSSSGNGEFSVPVPPGSFLVEVKAGNTLSNKTIPPAQTIIVNSQSTRENFGTLKPGDANGDNINNILDFSILRATFGTFTNCANQTISTAISCADFDGDGQVTVKDFSWLRAYFGKSGPITNP